VGRVFASNHAEPPAAEHGDGRFYKLRDDPVVPLICPTCQLFFGITENANAGNHMATVHGVVFDVFV
jgi:hypothetical protein